LAIFPGEIRNAIETSVRNGASAFRQDSIFFMPNPAILISGVK